MEPLKLSQNRFSQEFKNAGTTDEHGQFRQEQKLDGGASRRRPEGMRALTRMNNPLFYLCSSVFICGFNKYF
jgi:hypothetical protein